MEYMLYVIEFAWANLQAYFHSSIFSDSLSLIYIICKEVLLKPIKKIFSDIFGSRTEKKKESLCKQIKME